MKKILFTLVGLSIFAAGAAAADPVPNQAFAVRNAGWFDGNGLTCPEICKRQRAVAEKETNTAPPVRVSYVCKVRQVESGRYQWLFGTQFGSRAACYAPELEGEYSEIFYCLCVKRPPRRSRPSRGAPPGALRD